MMHTTHSEKKSRIIFLLGGRLIVATLIDMNTFYMSTVIGKTQEYQLHSKSQHPDPFSAEPAAKFKVLSITVFCNQL